MGRTELGEAKELRQINSNFVNDPDPIVVSQADQPHADEINDIHLPNTKMYSRQASGVDKKELTMYNFFSQDKALPSWPLLRLRKFLELCRKAIKICKASGKQAAVISVAALAQLMDIAIRVHGIYERTGMLGPGEIRFQARMYLHLQYAWMTRVLYVNASAMAAFNAAVDHFIARFPSATLQAALTPLTGAAGSEAAQTIANKTWAAGTVSKATASKKADIWML